MGDAVTLQDRVCGFGSFCGVQLDRRVQPGSIFPIKCPEALETAEVNQIRCGRGCAGNCYRSFADAMPEPMGKVATDKRANQIGRRWAAQLSATKGPLRTLLLA